MEDSCGNLQQTMECPLQSGRVYRVFEAFLGLGFQGLGFGVGMFPLILTVLNRDSSRGYWNPY